MKDVIESIRQLLNLSEEWVSLLESAFDPKNDYQDGLSKWYKSSDGRFVKCIVKFLVLFSVINISASILRKIGDNYSDSDLVTKILSALSVDNLNRGLYVAETLVLIIITLNIVFFPNYKTSNTTNDVLKSASGAMDRFLRFWPYLWSSWFILYLLLTLIDFKAFGGGSKSPVALAFVNAANNLSGVVMFSMYFEMAERTDESTNRQNNLYIPAIMILLVLLAFELILTTRITGHATRISLLFSFISGIIVGVITGLLVTRLCSRFINLPLWAASFLTVYAVIQPVFPIIAQSQEQSVQLQQISEQEFFKSLSLYMAIIALYGKVLLLAIIHWVRDSNRLLYYMARARKVHDEEDKPEYRMMFKMAADKLHERVAD